MLHLLSRQKNGDGIVDLLVKPFASIHIIFENLIHHTDEYTQYISIEALCPITYHVHTDAENISTGRYEIFLIIRVFPLDPSSSNIYNRSLNKTIIVQDNH